MFSIILHHRSISTTLVLLTLILVTPLFAQPTNGLLVYYPCDGTGDHSENNLTPILTDLTNAPDGFGRANHSYWFNGSTSAMYASSALPQSFVVNRVTLAAWIRVTGGGTAVPRIIAVGPNTTNHVYSLLLNNNTTSLRRLYFYTNGGVTNAYSRAIIPTDSVWHHVAVTYDSLAVRFYFDGVLDTTVAVTGSLGTNTNRLHVGYSAGSGSNNRFHGNIDEVRIYNRELSAAEISTFLRLLWLTRPNGGESFRIGTTDTIRWQQASLSGNVRIDLNRSYPTGTWDSIATVAANTGQYLWNVTGAASVLSRIRVVSTTYSSVADTSDSLVRIFTPGLPSAYSLSFDGNSDSVDILTNIDFLYTTMEFWMKSNDLRTGTNSPSVVSWGIDNLNVYNTMYLDSGKIVVNGVPVNHFVCDNRWHHISIILIYALDRVNVFDNGVYVGDFDFNFRIGGTVDIKFGKSYSRNTDPHFFAGNICNVALWNCGRVAPQIQQDMYTTFTGTETGLIGYWRLNDGIGNIAFNDVPGALNGSISGASWSNDVPRMVKTTHPNGGESLITGTTDTIRWDSYNADSVRIELNRNYPTGQWEVVRNSISARAGQYLWNVTGTATASSRIRVIAIADSTIGDTSDSAFRIYTPGLPSTHSLAFDGSNDTVNIPNCNFDSSYTLEFWMKSSSLRMGTYCPVMVSWNRIGDPIDIQLDSGKASIFFEGFEETLNVFLSDNRWHHLALRWNHGHPNHEMDLYHDGTCILRWFQYNSSDSGSFVADIKLGKANTERTAPHFFAGKLGNVALWNYARSEAQIRQDVLTTFTGTETGLTGYWRLNDGSENIAYNDVSGSSKGTISGASWSHEFPSMGVTVERPNGGESFSIGTTDTIRWNTLRNDSVRIELNRYYPGSNWSILVGSYPAASGVYYWPVTGPVSSTARIRITVNNDTTTRDTSDAAFTIRAVEPSAPANLTITTGSNDAVLSWQPVTTNILGQTSTVSNYLVFYRASGTDNWAFHGFTTGQNNTTYTHSGVVRFSTVMLYQVRAYISDTSSSDRVLTGLPIGVSESEVLRQLSGRVGKPSYGACTIPGK